MYEVKQFPAAGSADEFTKKVAVLIKSRGDP